MKPLVGIGMSLVGTLLIGTTHFDLIHKPQQDPQTVAKRVEMLEKKVETLEKKDVPDRADYNRLVETIQNLTKEGNDRKAQAAPIGSIIAFAGSRDQIPPGWKLCDGHPFSSKTQENLYRCIGQHWGKGDGKEDEEHHIQDFNLPDLRGRFLRGVDKDVNGVETDPPRDLDRSIRIDDLGYTGEKGNEVGSVQKDEFFKHNHEVNDMGHAHREYGDDNQGHRAPLISNDHASGDGLANLRVPGKVPQILLGSTSYWISTSSEHANIVEKDKGGVETRPKNAYVYYIIRTN